MADSNDNPALLPSQTLFCPCCDYNLTGLPANRCPECGNEFDPESVRREVWAPLSRWKALGYMTLVPLIVIAPAMLGVVLCLIPMSIMRVLLPVWLALSGLALFCAIAITPMLAFHFAIRIAVARARRTGGERSGSKDHGFIALWTLGLLGWMLVASVVVSVVALIIGIRCLPF